MLWYICPGEMRPLVSWMTKVDDAILEWLEETDIAAPPKVIHANLQTPVSYSQVKRRVRTLNDNGLIYKDEERGEYYAISPLGRWYLQGEIKGSELEALDTEAGSPSELFGTDADGI